MENSFRGLKEPLEAVCGSALCTRLVIETGDGGPHPTLHLLVPLLHC